MYGGSLPPQLQQLVNALQLSAQTPEVADALTQLVSKIQEMQKQLQQQNSELAQYRGNPARSPVDRSPNLELPKCAVPSRGDCLQCKQAVLITQKRVKCNDGYLHHECARTLGVTFTSRPAHQRRPSAEDELSEMVRPSADAPEGWEVDGWEAAGTLMWQPGESVPTWELPLTPTIAVNELDQTEVSRLKSLKLKGAMWRGGCNDNTAAFSSDEHADSPHPADDRKVKLWLRGLASEVHLPVHTRMSRLVAQIHCARAEEGGVRIALVTVLRPQEGTDAQTVGVYTGHQLEGTLQDSGLVDGDVVHVTDQLPQDYSLGEDTNSTVIWLICKLCL